MDNIQAFWNEFCVTHNSEGIEYKEAFQFGASPDLLATLVVEGKKTATTSGFVFYELENEPLPEVGEYAIVLNGSNEPVAVVVNEAVNVVPMNEVSEAFALAEGEGDYQYWWDTHEKFFTDLLKDYNLPFAADMLVVCEQFTKVYSK